MPLAHLPLRKWGNVLQWNLGWNFYIFIQENAFKNVIRKLADSLSRLQCANTWYLKCVCICPAIWIPYVGARAVLESCALLEIVLADWLSHITWCLDNPSQLCKLANERDRVWRQDHNLQSKQPLISNWCTSCDSKVCKIAKMMIWEGIKW